MCGIAGRFSTTINNPVDKSLFQKMIYCLRHRGPDDYGVYLDDHVGLAQSRLSIIDLSGGKQPIHNEDKSIWVIFNGEIFNYIELTETLQKKGHTFYTKSDTEVIVHAYEEYGTNFVNYLNGQFAISVWDSKKQEMILARDRVGIRPLFYTVQENGSVIFGSEIKAIFEHPQVRPEIDIAGLNQIFSLWVNVPPTTPFKKIFELAPGNFLKISKRGIKQTEYWKPEFPYEGDYEQRSLKYYTDNIQELLYQAVTRRLRADVPVASYLSGGIDSSIISALVKKYHNNDLITFSVAFTEGGYDERPYQNQMVEFLKTDHRMVEASNEKISNVFSDVIYYAEKPTIRTAPAPLFILSKLVRENNIKVVLTGEGADEVFGGYNIFKEDKIRRFWAKNPNSQLRPQLLKALYPYILKGNDQAKSFWQLFFKKGLSEVNDPYYSHRIRWNNTSQIKRYFRKDYKSQFDDPSQIYDALDNYIDPDIKRWHPMCRAQYLEMKLFMSGYLLSTQGDRMMMGNSVEGRFPFLDHTLIDFVNKIPPHLKIKVLNEKYLLKAAFSDLIPESIINRPKQPYRAPINKVFVNGQNKNISHEMLYQENLENSPFFDSKLVANLLVKMSKSDAITSARDDMALVSIVSLQLLHHHFIDRKQIN
jgi:asparagine synthase (glutamine-hydrolysing)